MHLRCPTGVNFFNVCESFARNHDKRQTFNTVIYIHCTIYVHISGLFCIRKTRFVDENNDLEKKHFSYRCKSFQSVKRGEICRIPGCSVSTSAPGTPTPVRLPQFQGETFKQFINYVYTGKVCVPFMLTDYYGLKFNNLYTSCFLFIHTK